MMLFPQIENTGAKRRVQDVAATAAARSVSGGPLMQQKTVGETLVKPSNGCKPRVRRARPAASAHKLERTNQAGCAK